LNKCEPKQASFNDQIAPSNQIGKPDSTLTYFGGP
jgi:hypothetical protein